MFDHGSYESGTCPGVLMSVILPTDIVTRVERVVLEDILAAGADYERATNNLHRASVPRNGKATPVKTQQRAGKKPPADLRQRAEHTDQKVKR